MTINYIAVARENREKALAGLKHNRRPFLALSNYAVYVRPTRRTNHVVFMSARNPSPFTQANLH